MMAGDKNPELIEIFKDKVLTSGSSVGRFLKKINQIFKRDVPCHPHLNGRITELQKASEKTILELKKIKTFFAQNIHSDLLIHVTIILNSLIKEIARIRKVIERGDSTLQQVKIFQRHVDSIEKAKVWIELGSSRHHIQKIYHEVLNHNIQEFCARIDRDLQVIQDYLDFVLTNQTMNEQIKESFKEKLEPALEPHLLELTTLRAHPHDISLEGLILWRADADKAREKCFSAALHVIDVLAGEFSTNIPEYQESAHSRTIVLHLDLLEEKISDFACELIRLNKRDLKAKKILQGSFEALEEEAHLLNSDLRLTQEHIERIQHLLEILQTLHKKI